MFQDLHGDSPKSSHGFVTLSQPFDRKLVRCLDLAFEATERISKQASEFGSLYQDLAIKSKSVWYQIGDYRAAFRGKEMSFSGRAEPLDGQGLLAAAAILGVSVEAIWTVVTVETGGHGFLPDRRPVVLFERHEFRRRTAGRFDASHPGISGPPGGYGPGGANQYDRLAQAVDCDRRAALESTSWGLGQIMGYNAAAAGHPDVEHMVTNFLHSESAQLLAMARFVRHNGLHQAMQSGDWAAFARGYNGPNYTINRYDTKLAATHASLRNTGMPDIGLRAAQLMLTFEGFDPGPVDGRVGPRTRDAIRRFRASYGIGTGDTHDPELLAALRSRLPDSAPAVPAEPAAGRTPSLRRMQALLTAIGLDPGAADGIDGPRTRAAVAQVVPQGLTAPDLLRRRAAAALARPAAAARVTAIAQEALRAHGFDPGQIDGRWGPRTAGAVQQFRILNGLPPAQQLDAATLARLLLDERGS
jgi:peptidoglycan hydrolase-like protein with peptidoglycan-binding domain